VKTTERIDTVCDDVSSGSKFALYDDVIITDTESDDIRGSSVGGCQVPSVHVHHEHRDDPHNGHHHQLELPYTADSSHATVDPRHLPGPAAATHHDDKTFTLVSLVPHTAGSLSSRHLSWQSQTGATAIRLCLISFPIKFLCTCLNFKTYLSQSNKNTEPERTLKWIYSFVPVLETVRVLYAVSHYFHLFYWFQFVSMRSFHSITRAQFLYSNRG